MRKKEVNILAVNPGTKYLGLAAFQGSDLVYWGVKVLKGKWSREKMRSIEKILLDLIGQHEITVLTLKTLHSSRSSRNLNCLVAAVERLAKKKRLKVRLYSLDNLKNFLALGMKINKIDMAGMAVARVLPVSLRDKICQGAVPSVFTHNVMRGGQRYGTCRDEKRPAHPGGSSRSVRLMAEPERTA